MVNQQPIPIAVQSKSISLEQICYKRSQGIVVTALHCFLFPTSKNKGLKRTSKSTVRIKEEISSENWFFDKTFLIMRVMSKGGIENPGFCY